jgi:PleD family two-component response regulator
MRVNTKTKRAVKRYAAVLTNDIFFSSKIREAAKSNGIAVEFIKGKDGLIDRLLSRPPSVIILDLSCRKLNPVRLIGEIKSTGPLKGIPMIGYLPHMDTDLKNEAVKEGCDTLLPRSRFAREAGEILRKFTSE